MRLPNTTTSDGRKPGPPARSWLWTVALASAVGFAGFIAFLRAPGKARVPLRPPVASRILAGSSEPRSSPRYFSPSRREPLQAEGSPRNANSERGAAPLVRRVSTPEATAAIEYPPSPPAPAPVPTPAPTLSMHEARRVLHAALAAWLQPGVCGGSAEASQVRERVSSSFRLADFGDKGRLYLDPRLPPAAELPVLDSVSQAEHELDARLGLRPPRPMVFVYADRQLMKASACINEDVVAFYDGALHVVVNRPDLLASVLHEYAHHAMFSAGLMAPAWAQEGIAMNIAKERWWRERPRLQALLDAPFALDEMDRAIPYKLRPQQALAFYVQSAAFVECLMRARHWSLQEVFEKLRARVSTEAVTYDLPELERRSFLRDCLEQGLLPG